MTSVRPSFVIGNSWQVNHLTAEERTSLDHEPFVFVCNLFPQHWRRIGFRPTVWVMGDTFDSAGCDILSSQLSSIKEDTELRLRLQHLFVCVESSEALHVVKQFDLPITLYRRGNWSDCGQSLAANLNETILHYGSTLTDVVNLALIINPEGEVRLFGCQYGDRADHFYDPTPDAHRGCPIFPLVVERMWEQFSRMSKNGTRLYDCNYEHSEHMPNAYRISRRPLLK